MPRAIATNHQHGPEAAECFDVTRSEERRELLEELFTRKIAPDALGDIFLKEPLFQRNYAAGFGTLFTAVYDPTASRLTLRWPGRSWSQHLDAFREGRREIRYLDDLRPVVAREGRGARRRDEGAGGRPTFPVTGPDASLRPMGPSRPHVQP